MATAETGPFPILESLASAPQSAPGAISGLVHPRNVSRLYTNARPASPVRSRIARRSVGGRSRAAHAASGSTRRGRETSSADGGVEAKRKEHRARRTARPRAGEPASIAGRRMHDLAWAGQHAKAIELATKALSATGLDVATRGSTCSTFVPKATSRKATSRAPPRTPMRCSCSPTARSRPPSRRRHAIGRRSCRCAGASSGKRRRAPRAALKAGAPVQAGPARGNEPVPPGRSAVSRQVDQRARPRAMPRAPPSSSKRWATRSGQGARCGRSPPPRATWAASTNRDRRRRQRWRSAASCGDLYGARQCATTACSYNLPDIAANLKAAEPVAGFLRGGGLCRAAGRRHRTTSACSTADAWPVSPRAAAWSPGRLRFTRSGASAPTRQGLTSCRPSVGSGDGAPRRGANCLATRTRESAAATQQDAAFIVVSLTAGSHFREGDLRRALPPIKRGVKMLRALKNDVFEIGAARLLGEVELAAGNPRAALTATRRATACIARMGLCDSDGPVVAASIWWMHSRALAANREAGRSREALETAYRLMLEGIAQRERRGTAPQLPRQGPRSSRDHRRLAQGRAQAQAVRRAARRASRGRGEPARAVRATGGHRAAAERAAQRRRAARIPDRRGDRALRAPSACCWCSNGPDGPRLAGSLVPRGEDAAALLRDVTPVAARGPPDARRGSHARSGGRRSRWNSARA